jgi:hypothetical protein
VWHAAPYSLLNGGGDGCQPASGHHARRPMLPVSPYCMAVSIRWELWGCSDHDSAGGYWRGRGCSSWPEQHEKRLVKINPNCSDICSDVHTYSDPRYVLTLVHVSDFTPHPCPAEGRAELGGRRAAVGLGDEGELANFCPRVFFTLLRGEGWGEGERPWRLGDGRSLTFV